MSPANEECAKKRALRVLQWFLSTLKHQHAGKDENGKRKKMKPLNPFLGEIFLGQWQDDVGTTQLISEQVSHHPPATAFCIRNESHGVRVRAHFSHFQRYTEYVQQMYSLYMCVLCYPLTLD